MARNDAPEEPAEEPLVPEEQDDAGEVAELISDPDALERALLGRRIYTRVEVAEKAGVGTDVSQELWQQLGFPQSADDDVAFTRRDLRALRRTQDLMEMGFLTPQSQAALVRTWGRAFARLAEWQVSLLADVALQADDPERKLGELIDQVLPAVEDLQAYAWRRHLASASNRMLARSSDPTTTTSTVAVGFVDIVGYTGQSRTLSDTELVDWMEHFEDTMTRVVVEHQGRIIKTIGDEVLFVTDDPVAAAEVTLTVTERGSDADDPFPSVRAGVAYGEVVSRLGDVFGSTVNVASRLTSVARPGTVLVDRGAYEALSAADTEPREDPPEKPLARILDRAASEVAELSPFTSAGGYRFRRLPRRHVKGYSRLEPWLLRRASG